MPAGATYEPIATSTLGTAGFFTFSSIPSTYTDLKLVLVGGGDGGTVAVRLQFNSDTGFNYSNTVLIGDGASATSTRQTGTQNISTGNFDMPNAASAIGVFIIDIFSYAGSTNKTVLETNAGDRNGSGNVSRNVGLWRSTSAINSIYLSGGRNFAVGTMATLYGIKAA